MTGPGAVKGERMGLSPLAVQELAKEFRRLAEQKRIDAEADAIQKRYYWVHRYRGMAYAYEEAAQMLEERLNG